MSTNDNQQDKRNAARTNLVKLTFIKKGDTALGCLLRDISVSGASVDLLKLPGLDANPFVVGDDIEIVVDEVGSAHGKVARSDLASVAIVFDGLNDDEKSFIETLASNVDA